MKRFLPVIIIVAVFGLAVGAGAYMFRSAKTTPTPTPTPSASPAVANQAKAPEVALAPGQILIEEFGDYQCPPCGALHPDIKKIKGEYGDKIKFVFHHFPLTRIHKNAAIAAFSAAAAAQQGKFQEMHDLLYESQQVWAETDNFAPILVNFARQLALNPEQFEHDLNDPKVRAIVVNDVQLGESRGVTGTPTVFIDGELTEGDKLEPKNLRKEIDRHLKLKAAQSAQAH